MHVTSPRSYDGIPGSRVEPVRGFDDIPRYDPLVTSEVSSMYLGMIARYPWTPLRWTKDCLREYQGGFAGRPCTRGKDLHEARASDHDPIVITCSRYVRYATVPSRTSSRDHRGDQRDLSIIPRRLARSLIGDRGRHRGITTCRPARHPDHLVVAIGQHLQNVSSLPPGVLDARQHGSRGAAA
jgi:hypothetical protein